MKCDVILAGVGGQGVLSIAAIIARAAAGAGFRVRQSEVHGMAQRGGAVLAHLRLAEGAIAGDLVPRGGADAIISMEPLESLRYLSWLAPSGAVVTAMEPFINIPNYPEIAEIRGVIQSLPRTAPIEAAALAKEAGLARAVNMVMVGAASPYLPVSTDALENTIEEMFAAKDPKLAEANKKAFNLGRTAGNIRPA
ncbi:MAG: indolepyruvate oxidoreductase subunit beta [Spirochaetaceae bacterium]|jgi:indolepyruvate ferredoxin oxidoreductase beta subunit|nr:indolepyruvate oxidoreductase subunit beta [Spirochaetaceae bacterium]